MAYRAGVVGGSGYTGAELLRLLAAHPEIEVVHVTADSNAGATVGALYPSLAAAYPAFEYASYAPADLAGVDVAFVALPHGESQLIAPALIERVGHVVDLGADFRLPSGVGRTSPPPVATRPPPRWHSPRSWPAGSSRRRASSSTPCRACRGAAEASRRRASTPRRTRTSPPTRSSRIAIR